MKVKHLDHINLSVENFDETVDWYKRVFGFELVEEAVVDGVRFGVIRSGDAMLCIYEHEEFEHESTEEMSTKKLHRIAHFGIRITDKDEFDKIVEKENLEVMFGEAYRYPHSYSWYIFDPTGYEIEVACWDDDKIKFD